MAWEGYFQYAGQEFINAERTEAYATHAGAGWLKSCFGTSDLGPMLGESYRSPMLDPAPWTDPDAPESYQFYGVYPLGVTGLEDSTRQGSVVESIADGGTVGRIRHGTRSVVFNIALVGASDCAVDYGARWLRRLLLGAACGTQATEACSGDDLCYLSCEPVLDWDHGGTLLDVLGCLDPYERSLRRVIFNSGPTITGKQNTHDGGAVWTATVTAVAGNPWEFSTEVPIVENFGSATNPYVCDPPGLVGPESVVDDTASDSSCKPPAYFPVFDPSCPAFIQPPAYPSVPLGCYTPPANWKRRQFTIPEEFIPLWGEVVPKIEVHAPAKTSVRNLRLRFYADVDGDGDITDDLCAYCGDIVISYVPAGQTLVFDGSDQLVYVEGAGGVGQRRADSLVFATNGTPFEWPVLSCGFGYIVAVDTPQTTALPTIDLSLYSRAA
jgi:hypothetical protein